MTMGYGRTNAGIGGGSCPFPVLSISGIVGFFGL